MASYGTAFTVQCNMPSNNFSLDIVTSSVSSGTADVEQRLGNTGFRLTVRPDADDSKGSEGGLLFLVANPFYKYYFTIRYVCNNKLNNSIAVRPMTGQGGFDVISDPAPDAMKTKAPLVATITIKPK